MAEDIGVCAEPEVEVQLLSSEHPFMVIASDGVFEFLTNQEVINMVRLFLANISPQSCPFFVSYAWRNPDASTECRLQGKNLLFL